MLLIEDTGVLVAVGEPVDTGVWLAVGEPVDVGVRLVVGETVDTGVRLGVGEPEKTIASPNMCIYYVCSVVQLVKANCLLLFTANLG